MARKRPKTRKRASARKRANGEGTIIQLANGRWRAEISVVGPDGKRRRPSRTEETRADAGEALKELLEEAGKADKPQDMTVKAWMDLRHELWAAGDIAPGTV